MTKSPRPECPECEKLVSIHEKSQQLGLFLDWVLRTQGKLCVWVEEGYYDAASGASLENYEQGCGVIDEGYFPIHKSIEKILAEYFDIDLDKVDKERVALLDWIRKEEL